MSYDPTKVAFVDTETTGLDPEQHKVWEIAVIVDGVEHAWTQHLPGWCMCSEEPCEFRSAIADPWVLENTGIRERYDSRIVVGLDESTRRFADLVRGRHLVGACPWFDSERLHRQWLLHGPLGASRQHPWHYHLIDVETLIVGNLQGALDSDDERRRQALPWDSRELSRFVGVNPDDFQPAHTALTDARWAKACFEAVMGGPT